LTRRVLREAVYAKELKAEDRLSAVFLIALWHLKAFCECYRRTRRDATALRFVLLSILGTTSSFL